LFLENLLTRKLKRLWKNCLGNVRTAETSTKTIGKRDIGGYIFIELILF
jgi:hypothetical protein